MSQGPEYGDASACLKITYPGDPARPAERLFKMRAPTAGEILAEIAVNGIPRRHLESPALRAAIEARPHSETRPRDSRMRSGVFARAARANCRRGSVV